MEINNTLPHVALCENSTEVVEAAKSGMLGMFWKDTLESEEEVKLFEIEEVVKYIKGQQFESIHEYQGITRENFLEYIAQKLPVLQFNDEFLEQIRKDSNLVFDTLETLTGDELRLNKSSRRYSVAVRIQGEGVVSSTQRKGNLAGAHIDFMKPGYFRLLCKKGENLENLTFEEHFHRFRGFVSYGNHNTLITEEQYCNRDALGLLNSALIGLEQSMFRNGKLLMNSDDVKASLQKQELYESTFINRELVECLADAPGRKGIIRIGSGGLLHAEPVITKPRIFMRFALDGN